MTLAPIGALVIAWTQEEEATLPALADRAVENGVTDIEFLDRTALRQAEPELGPHALAARSMAGLKRRTRVTMGRCSDPSYYAAGNMLRPVETAGWCWAEGRATGRAIPDGLDGKAPGPRQPIMLASDVLSWVVPQFSNPNSALSRLQLRVNRPVRGRLTISIDGTDIVKKGGSTRDQNGVSSCLCRRIADRPSSLWRRHEGACYRSGHDFDPGIHGGRDRDPSGPFGRAPSILSPARMGRA